MTNTPTERIGQVDVILCAKCKRSTKHTIRGSYVNTWVEDETGVEGGSINDLLSCNGCDAVTYRETMSAHRGGCSRVILRPPRGEVQPIFRPELELPSVPFSHLPRLVYLETNTAFNHHLATLTGAGVRLVIEGLCKDCGITDGPVKDEKGVVRRRNNLEGKINGLVERGLIAEKQAQALHEIRFLGNDAAHELHRPSNTVLHTALNIVEHLFIQVYEHPTLMQKLASRDRPTKS